MKKNNIYVFPLIKKSEQVITDEEVTLSEIDEIAKHYMGQLSEHLDKHGFEMNSRFTRDFDFAYEFLRSALLRNVGRHHPFQDYVDDFDEFILEKKEEESDI